ncbi:butyrophilin subfamily 2 member A2-like [Xyrauchen texanus]|uniref:butyrophilin subfamily 2 member A2-like n=1 Tax=Xyrauchen texanus TaxID=154827 RepID=UPI002241BC89|nr:butyrophilin subfamily 2 member A2-like [Xyrauchen texanus]
MMKECLQFLIEPAKKIKFHIKETRKRVKHVKKEPLTESQLFIMELARELNRICQRSDILAHIWTGEDVWPPHTCREFILETASILEMKEITDKPMQVYADLHPEKRDWKGHLLCMLEQGGEYDMGPSKRVIMDWTRGQRNRHPHGIWPGEVVLMMLDDVELQWKKGHLSHLQSALELLIWVVLEEHLDKELIPRLWLVQKQKTQMIECTGYIPHTVWNWICDATVEVTLDPETANPTLVLSEDCKRMHCDPERREVSGSLRRFDGWWCCLGSEGILSGRHYWEIEVGDHDWRLGVAKESALCKGYGTLNTQSGYLTLRLERGSELKALTVPATSLPQSLIPQRVGVYLDYEEGQLSFYDTKRRAHIYTYSERFTERLYPLFGTVEMVRDLVIRPADVRERCLCKGLCLF